VLGKGKKTNSPHEDEPVKKKRTTMTNTSGEGGSRQQQPPLQPQQEQQEGLSYAAALVANYPHLAAYQHSWSDRFYLEACKKRYAQIKKFKILQEK
ncbi:hypothetical protein A2U01_0055065, partial [Trifolium medium]|nr:hypothetical protein [Trifolium medium]